MSSIWRMEMTLNDDASDIIDFINTTDSPSAEPSAQTSRTTTKGNLMTVRPGTEGK